jgi:hypothetical protein
VVVKCVLGGVGAGGRLRSARGVAAVYGVWGDAVNVVGGGLLWRVGWQDAWRIVLRFLAWAETEYRGVGWGCR